MHWPIIGRPIIEFLGNLDLHNCVCSNFEAMEAFTIVALNEPLQG